MIAARLTFQFAPMHSGDTQIRDRLREFIRESFLYMRPELTVGDDDRLLERGVIDSMGVVEMLSFVEDEFGVAVADDEITETNFGSIRSVAELVARKQATRAA